MADRWRALIGAGAALLVAGFLAGCTMPEADAPPDDTASEDSAEPGIGELGGMCGGFGGFQCKSEDAYCREEPGTCSEIADNAGTCTVKPEVCTMEYRPVCGCDGNTYGNACSAAGKGVSVDYEGECADAS